jgi:hypothetical protein
MADKKKKYLHDHLSVEKIKYYICNRKKGETCFEFL